MALAWVEERGGKNEQVKGKWALEGLLVHFQASGY